MITLKIKALKDMWLPVGSYKNSDIAFVKMSAETLCQLSDTYPEFKITNKADKDICILVKNSVGEAAWHQVQ